MMKLKHAPMELFHNDGNSLCQQILHVNAIYLAAQKMLNFVSRNDFLAKVSSSMWEAEKYVILRN